MPKPAMTCSKRIGGKDLSNCDQTSYANTHNPLRHSRQQSELQHPIRRNWFFTVGFAESRFVAGQLSGVPRTSRPT